MKRLCFILSVVLLVACHRGGETASPFDCEPRDTRAPGFVYVDSAGFHIDGRDWFPVMINYKLRTSITPEQYYFSDDMESHFLDMEQMGFNAVRVCLDRMNVDDTGYCLGQRPNLLHLSHDTAEIFRRYERVLDAADAAHLKVMLLIMPPMDEELEDYTRCLLRHFSNRKTLFAYDFFNEPLYFDSCSECSKAEIFERVNGWRQMMNECAPNQLFTIGFAEPTEVFKWDPSLLPVDFVQIHTYHPMRAANEMYWYSRYIGKPWMVGETALPADGDTISYEDQIRYLYQSYQMALDMGAIGYGWWEYMDCATGPNFEAWHCGMLTPQKKWKPITQEVARLKELKRGKRMTAPPDNFYNMLRYENFVLQGVVLDDKGRGVEGAVIRGWNEDWSVGVNTFSDKDGVFHLWSNDICVHFSVSAPGFERVMLYQDDSFMTFEEGDYHAVREMLSHRSGFAREYQQIPLLEGLRNDTIFFRYKDLNEKDAVRATVRNPIVLHRLTQR